MFVPYICDVETTGFDLINCDVIELSLIRFTTGEQKTWHLQPQNFEAIEQDALRVNGHKLEDLLWRTAYGRETYKPAKEVIVDIENWIMDDDVPSEKRLFVAHNVPFDLPRLRRLWQKCDEEDSFPFGRRSLDTMSIEFFLDWCKDDVQKGYSLKNLVKKYKLHNEKAHTAEADTKVTSEVFSAQINTFKDTISGGDKDLINQNKKMSTFISSIRDLSNNVTESDVGSLHSKLIELFQGYDK